MLTHGMYRGIFMMGIFGNFYTNQGRFLTSRVGIPGGLVLRNFIPHFNIF